MNSCWNFCLKCLLSSIEWLEILRSLWICLARDSNMQQSPLHEPFKQCCYASVSSLSTHFTKLKNHGIFMKIFHMNHTHNIHIYPKSLYICILHRYSKTYVSYVFCTLKKHQFSYHPHQLRLEILQFSARVREPKDPWRLGL